MKCTLWRSSPDFCLAFVILECFGRAFVCSSPHFRLKFINFNEDAKFVTFFGAEACPFWIVGYISEAQIT